MFEPLAGFSLGDFGLFWASIRDQFPRTETREAIDHKIESPHFRPQTFQLRLAEGHELPRCFYFSESGTELVQVQANRFSFNWLGRDGGSYPRSEATMARFCELFEIFKAFVDERKLGPLNLVQCELVNVNIVPVAEFGNSFADAGKVFKVPEPEGIDFLPPESYITNTQHQIIGAEGLVGRLYVVLSPVIRVDDDQQAYRFELTARGAPGAGEKGIAQFFDIARSALNGAFVASTTAWAHQQWGLKDG